MKKAQLYAQTLQHASVTKTDSELETFFDNFMKLLDHKKEKKLLPAIVREFKSLQEKASKGSGTTLVVRDTADADKYKQELSKHSDTFSLDEMTVVEDKTIVGGFIAKNSQAMLDRSYKKGLVDMYKKLIK